MKRFLTVAGETNGEGKDFFSLLCCPLLPISGVTSYILGDKNTFIKLHKNKSAYKIQIHYKRCLETWKWLCGDEARQLNLWKLAQTQKHVNTRRLFSSSKMLWVYLMRQYRDRKEEWTNPALRGQVVGECASVWQEWVLCVLGWEDPQNGMLCVYVRVFFRGGNR